MKASRTTGLMVAAAAAAMFAAGSVATSPAYAADVKCMGANSCKGHSACKTATSSCAGQNACKGQGWTKSASAAECTKSGGTPS